MKSTRVLLLALGVAACGGTAIEQASVTPAAPGVGSAAYDAAVSSIQPRDFFARIGFLASDALGGRDTPSPGLEAAAEYIKSEFHSFGVKPAGDNGTYFQRWPYTTRTMDAAALRAEFTVGGRQVALRAGSDFYARPGVRGSFSGPIVFAGAEIPATNRDALRGSAVVVAPAGAVNNQALFRMRAAADSAGAGALVIVLPAEVTEAQVAQFAARSAGGPGAIPVFYIRRDRASEILGAALNGSAVTRIANATGNFNATVVETVHQVPNVVGVIEGSDPELRNTYVVFSAHFDHVGSNCAGVSATDNICNGADDDASGTSAVMELAEAFSMMPVKPKRSLMFLLVSGEEKGLLGSRHFADNPTVPIESMIANVNIDMIGRNDPDSVIIIGKEYSSLGPLLDRVNAQHPELNMTTSDDLWPEQRFFFRSDHFNFARREVPAIFFFTGTHEDYHAASDHVEKIDLDKITRITRLIFHYANAIANDTNTPQWDPAGLEEVRRLVNTGR